MVLACLIMYFQVVLFNDVFHVGSAKVTYFDCVGVDYFIEFVVLCKVLLDQFQKCFANIRFCLLVRKWVEPYYFSLSVRILVITMIFIEFHVCFIVT